MILHRNILSFVSFFLLAFNLRPAITAIGPLVGNIQITTGLSSTAVGLLNSLPLLAFAAFASLADLGRRFGLERMLAFAMATLFVGILLRSAGPVWALFAGTLVLAAGIAIGNVLAPAIIKRDYSEHVGMLTTVYALVLALTASLGSGLAVPLERSLSGGWRASLAVWAIPAAAATLLWARSLLRAPHSASFPEIAPSASVWRSPLAWCVTAFMGFQSLGFYVVVAWLPSVIRDSGYDEATAGLLITGFQLVSLVAGLAFPRLLAFRPDQSALAIGSALVMTAGILGFLLYPAGTILWTVLTGVSAGLSFPLAIALISLRTADHHQATSLSLMSQSMGYLLAASGPLLFGMAHDLSGGWMLPLAGLAACSILQAVAGFFAGQSRVIATA
ncbi:MFS transporter [Chelativorans composti]|uniref:CynX/NimT family MFS transporter n=1 Tax=Chelativorans composti TaxID=768533 RepID=A0ABW5DFF3_9HYPH